MAIGIIILFFSAGIVSAFNVNLNDESEPMNLDNWFFIGESCEKQPYNIKTLGTMPLDQNPIIAEMIQEINEGNIYSTVYTLQNFTTRFYGTTGNTEASTWIYNKLCNISGLTVEYQGGDYKNVIATLPGLDNTSNSIYMVGAHYDTVNLTYAPGATDNGGGVAIVLELARIMSQYTFNHTLKFALWNQEEGGMWGSHAYVDYAKANNLNISLYFNYDSSCYDPDNHFILDIMYNNQSIWVKDMMTQYNSLYNIGFNLTYNIHTCNSDHRSFWNHGYTAVMTHSETHGLAHTSNDTVDKVNTLYAKKNGQLGMSVLANLSIEQNAPPNVPSNPSPANGSTNVDINADLSWGCSDPNGDNLTYDVYFEANDPTPDVLVSNNQTETTYEPGTMNYTTHYYWQIIAWDNHGAHTNGSIWGFTTTSKPNNPPYTPSNPNPENGSTGIDVDADLSWIGGDPDEGDIVVYDVVLNGRKVADDISETTFDPGTLDYGKIYYWRIIAKDNHGASIMGPLWGFTTKENSPPNTPSINGSHWGVVDEIYNCIVVTTDVDGEDVYYYIDWGDNNTSGWLGPYASGVEIEVNHTWSKKGTYIIKMKAKDVNNLESDWATLEVTIPRNKSFEFSINNWLFKKFPQAIPILRKIFGL